MSPRLAFALLCLLLLTPALRAEFPEPHNNQPETIPLTPPEKTVGLMHLPPGFQATLFAAEPDVRQPIAMCWDERGRLWVAENYTYSDQKERFDLTLKDRILIFEDSKNTGHFDKRTVFSEDLQMLTSIERGLGGVYALCPPNLLWIPTKDDKPTGPPQVLLDGFSTTAASRHTFANGLKWGPDGWLYGRIGISSTSWLDVPGTPLAQRRPTAGGVWRYHPVRKIFEPYCHGTTNPWGMDWDEHGEMFFINTVIGHLWHGIRGAHFKRMHGEDPYPHIYDLIDQHADHYHWDTGKKWMETRDATGLTDQLGGGHAHVGMLIYQGLNFPPEYRGKLLTTNLHGRRVNVERLDPEGSGYVGRHEPDFMKSDDPWFRATEIQYGPDGGVYILDWSDIGECHEADGVHRTSGRIYKITYGEAKRPAETDLTKLSAEALVHLQVSDNEWLARMARWELRERAARGETPVQALDAWTATLPTTGPAAPRLKALWLAAWLHGLGSSPLDAACAALAAKASTGAPEIDLTIWKERLQLDPASALFPKLPQPDQIARLNAEGASSPRIRLEIASHLPQFAPADRLALAAPLLQHADDAGDHNLPLMYWYGLSDLAPADLVQLAPACRIPLVRRLMARRITEEIDKDPAPLNTLLTQVAHPGTAWKSADLLQGMADALKGWRRAKKPAAWDAFVATTAGDAATQDALRDLNVLFGDGRALGEVTAIARDEKADTTARRAALETLIEAKAPDLREVCLAILGTPTLGITAIQGLATLDDPALAAKIVGRYKSLYPHERPQALAALASRPSFAKVLLQAVADDKIPRADVTPIIARQIQSFQDAPLTQKLTEVWGQFRESGDDKKQLIATLRGKLTPPVLAQGDARQGRLLFTQTCALCHKLYGEGADIGPDLTGSGRHELNYLLENIIDPSAIVAADFRMSVITLKDGRVLNGIIHGQSERTLTVKMIGQETTVERSEITHQEQLPISMMPEGLLQALSDEQVRNLIVYLMGNNQVPLP